MMLTLPNILTLSRIFAVPLLVVLLWPVGGWFDYALAFALYGLNRASGPFMVQLR